MTTTDGHDKIFEAAERLCLDAVEDPTLLPAYADAHREAQSLEHQGWKRSTGMTQNDKILKHLKKAGSITVREALVEYSVSSLTKRISELREMGHKIQSEVKRHPVTGQSYTRYHLKAA